MIVHNPSVKLGKSARGRAPLGAPNRSGVRRVVPGHIRVTGDPLDGPSDGAGRQEGPKSRDEGRVGALCVPVLPEAAFSVLAVGEDDAVCRGVVARADLRLDVLKDHPNGPELPELVGAAP